MPDSVPNKIKFGIKGCYYAVATIAANNSATYGTPVALPGAVNLSLSPQGETNSFYADNIDYYTTVSNTGYEGDLELARLPESFLKDVLGYKVDSNGVLYEDANAPTVPFALRGRRRRAPLRAVPLHRLPPGDLRGHEGAEHRPADRDHPAEDRRGLQRRLGEGSRARHRRACAGHAVQRLEQRRVSALGSRRVRRVSRV